MGCNQSSDATTASGDAFRERRNRLRDRQRGITRRAPVEHPATAAAAVANNNVSGGGGGGRSKPFPSSRDIPGFVNPLAGVPDFLMDGLQQDYDGVSQGLTSQGIASGGGGRANTNTSTVATQRGTLGPRDDISSYYATDIIVGDANDDKPNTHKLIGDRGGQDDDDDGYDIGRLADVPEAATSLPNEQEPPSFAALDSPRRAGMHENVGARQSLDTTNGAEGDPRRRHAGAATGESGTGTSGMRAALRAGEDGASSNGDTVAVFPTAVVHASPVADLDRGTQLPQTGAAGPSTQLTTFAVTMHRRHMRALAAASGYDSYDAPIAAWVEESILMVRVPQLRATLAAPS